MQAIILAAGMGKRLKDLTKNNTKCMIEVNGVTLIERMLNQLDEMNLSRIIIVIGYEGEKLIEFIKTIGIATNIVYVENAIYDKTNNIYSLYLAREYLLDNDTILLESDLIFENSVLSKIIEDPYPSLALVAKYENWMDGTVVILDEMDNIKHFKSKKEFVFNEMNTYYKTVNIYKFSKDFSITHYVPFLEAYCKALGHNEYYEQVLRVITLLDKPEIKAIKLDKESWYEIDDIQDLDIAESIFEQTPEKKLSKIQNRYGGYWRYPKMLDFCYLVNPYFPPSKLLDEIKANFERLICDYPSCLRINNLLASKYFEINQEYICVGNGAAELIKSLMTRMSGKMGIVCPTFEEYPNCRKGDIIAYYPEPNRYQYGANDIINFFANKSISSLVIINPDNPSGNYIMREEMILLLEWTKNRGITMIVDESFIDFVEIERSASIMDEEILSKYHNAIVVKSISKSYGVPGLRLGVIATYNMSVLDEIRKDLPIWNINSFAEFFLQIIEKYKGEYGNAILKFYNTRSIFIGKLNSIKGLRVIPTQANYIMCEVQVSASELTKFLLTDYNIFIKDLSAKNGIDGQYIRVAIKTEQENDLLVKALEALL